MWITTRLGIMMFIALLSGCVSESSIIEQDHYRIETRHQSQAAYPRVRMLVIHYTAEDFDRSLAILTDNQVSAHYLIPSNPSSSNEKPLIWQLVPEEKRAWHAGISSWRGIRQINDVSIGIELENPGWQIINEVKSFSPFNSMQITVLVDLMRDIIARYNIAPQNVVGHSDIAPQRKNDPGPLFPWQQLAEKGIGVWPDAERVTFYLNGQDPNQPIDTKQLLKLLSRYGYEVHADMTPAQKKRVISAFQMHFRPERTNGLADAQTLAIAEALVEKYGRHS